MSETKIAGQDDFDKQLQKMGVWYTSVIPGESFRNHVKEMLRRRHPHSIELEAVDYTGHCFKESLEENNPVHGFLTKTPDGRVMFTPHQVAAISFKNEWGDNWGPLAEMGLDWKREQARMQEDREYEAQQQAKIQAEMDAARVEQERYAYECGKAKCLANPMESGVGVIMPDGTWMSHERALELAHSKPSISGATVLDNLVAVPNSGIERPVSVLGDGFMTEAFREQLVNAGVVIDRSEPTNLPVDPARDTQFQAFRREHGMPDTRSAAEAYAAYCAMPFQSLPKTGVLRGGRGHLPTLKPDGTIVIDGVEYAATHAYLPKNDAGTKALHEGVVIRAKQNEEFWKQFMDPALGVPPLERVDPDDEVEGCSIVGKK